MTTPPRMVYFSVRTRDDSSLEEVGLRVERMLGLRFSPYEGKWFPGPVLECTVLGIWVVLAPVTSEQVDAPARYQLQGRQRPTDDAIFADAYHDIDDYILHVLNEHEPGRWYFPSERERRIDAGLERGRIQDDDEDVAPPAK